MTQLRFFIFALALLFSLTGFAQETFDTNPAEDQALDADIGDTLSYEGFNWYLTGGPSFDGNSLSGTGAGATATTIDPGTSFFYGTTLNWRGKGSQYSYHFRYRHTGMEVADVPGLTPDPFKYNKDWYNFLTKYRILNGRFYVGIGLYYYSKKLDATISDDVLVDQKYAGPTLAVGYSGKMSSIFNWEADLFLNLPFLIDEPEVTTGRYTMGLLPEVNFRLVFPYTKVLDLVLGLNVNYDYMKFKDAGTRGITDATETSLGIAVPVELRFRF